MTKFEIPKDGYWHCQVLDKKDRWPVEILDISFDKLDFEIVQPFIKNQQFFINGVRFTNSQEIFSIKIVHTPQKAEHYGKETLSSSHVYVFGPDITLVFEKGEDWTARLLYTDEPILNNQATEKEKSHEFTIVNNVNQTQSQTQHQEQNLTLDNIQQLQDAFADFRREYKKLPGVDDTILKETQDALDELSNTSSPAEKNKVFNKIINTARIQKRNQSHILNGFHSVCNKTVKSLLIKIRIFFPNTPELWRCLCSSIFYFVFVCCNYYLRKLKKLRNIFILLITTILIYSSIHAFSWRLAFNNRKRNTVYKKNNIRASVVHFVLTFNKKLARNVKYIITWIIPVDII